MEKIKSILYNVYSNSQACFPTELMDDADYLFEVVLDQIKKANKECCARIDIGHYDFTDSELIQKRRNAIIHIIISAPETEQIELAVEDAIKQNYIYREFDKFKYEENVLTQFNSNALDRLSMHQHIIKLHYHRSRRFFAITHQEAYDI